MLQRVCLFGICLGVLGCVERYPDSQYMSTYLTPNNGGGNGQDTTSGGGQDTASANDTVSNGPDVFADTPFLKCLKSYCPVPLAACGYNSGCIAILQCLGACDAADSVCQSNCYPTSGMNPAFESLFLCASSSCAP